MKIVSDIDSDLWKEFLAHNKDATIYHTKMWRNVLTKSFGYDSKYLFCLNENDLPVAFLPLMLIRSRIYGDRITSLPFSHICGPIGESNYFDILINYALDHYIADVDYCEFRFSYNKNDFSLVSNYVDHTLDLTIGYDQIYSNYDRKSVRWAVNKSKKNDVKIEVANDLQAVKDYYELNCITKKDLGVPCHPYVFFKNMFEEMSDNLRLYQAKKDGDLLASGIFSYFNRCIIYGYGAADPNYLKLYPYNAFIDKSIKDGCDSGYNKYDFGRSGKDNAGLINFKKDWGCKELELVYSYDSHLPNRSNKIKYFLGDILTLLPTNIYKWISDFTFYNFG